MVITDKIINTLSTKSAFSDVRYIEDVKDKVTANDTNRPHKDIVENYRKLSDIEDITRGVFTGNWSDSVSYAEGDIVTFMSDFYASKVNNNLGHVPELATSVKPDSFWNRIVKISGVDSGNIPKNINGLSIASDGKGFNTSVVKKGDKYTLLSVSLDTPIDESYTLSLIKPNDIVRIEFSLKYSKCRVNSRGMCFPELNIGSIFAGNSLVDYSLYNDEYDDSNALYAGYTRFGPYGCVLSLDYCYDRVFRLMLEVDTNCEVELSGGDGISRLMLTSSLAYKGVEPYYSVSYHVRPFSGDSNNSIGEVKNYPNQLSRLQQWNKGLLLFNNTLKLVASDFSHLLATLGYVSNFNAEATKADEMVVSKLNKASALYKANANVNFSVKNLTSVGLKGHIINVPAPNVNDMTKLIPYLQAF